MKGLELQIVLRTKSEIGKYGLKVGEFVLVRRKCIGERMNVCWKMAVQIPMNRISELIQAYVPLQTSMNKGIRP